MVLTQQDIADHLDLSQAAVSQMLEQLGLDWRACDLGQIRVAYIRRLRDQAAGRESQLSSERAALARAQTDRIEMQNAVTRGELAPLALIEEVLTKAASKVAGALDAIPGMVRRRVPTLTADDIDLIAGEVAKARNTAATMSLADLKITEDADVSIESPVLDELIDGSV